MGKCSNHRPDKGMRAGPRPLWDKGLGHLTRQGKPPRPAEVIIDIKENTECVVEKEMIYISYTLRICLSNSLLLNFSRNFVGEAVSR